MIAKADYPTTLQIDRSISSFRGLYNTERRSVPLDYKHNLLSKQGEARSIHDQTNIRPPQTTGEQL